MSFYSNIDELGFLGSSMGFEIRKFSKTLESSEAHNTDDMVHTKMSLAKWHHTGLQADLIVSDDNGKIAVIQGYMATSCTHGLSGQVT